MYDSNATLHYSTLLQLHTPSLAVSFQPSNCYSSSLRPRSSLSAPTSIRLRSPVSIPSLCLCEAFPCGSVPLIKNAMLHVGDSERSTLPASDARQSYEGVFTQVHCSRTTGDNFCCVTALEGTGRNVEPQENDATAVVWEHCRGEEEGRRCSGWKRNLRQTISVTYGVFW